MIKKKKIYIISLIILIIIIIFIILNINGIWSYLTIDNVFLLIKNKINFIKIKINDDPTMNTPNSMSSGDFQLLILELG
jgi:hypothetical protein